MIEGHDLELFERSLRVATEQHTGDALDAAVAELGWSDALGFDPRVAVSRLFELQGEACATSSALDHTIAFAIGRELDGATSIALPAVGEWNAPAQLERDRMTVRGLATAVRPSTVVVASSGERHVAATVDTSALQVRPVHGVDPWLGLVEVHGEVEVDDAEPVEWAEAVALAQLAVAHELVGASRKALALAREHALERIQFGQPIARFQAVRHRLAETLVARRDRDRRPRRRLARPVSGDRGDGQGDRRPERAHRRPPLPAGARRDRIHRRTRPPPLRAAHHGPRTALRRARDLDEAPR